jgi:hypothetical protein
LILTNTRRTSIQECADAPRISYKAGLILRTRCWTLLLTQKSVTESPPGKRRKGKKDSQRTYVQGAGELKELSMTVVAQKFKIVMIMSTCCSKCTKLDLSMIYPLSSSSIPFCFFSSLLHFHFSTR